MSCELPFSYVFGSIRRKENRGEPVDFDSGFFQLLLEAGQNIKRLNKGENVRNEKNDTKIHQSSWQVMLYLYNLVKA